MAAQPPQGFFPLRDAHREWRTHLLARCTGEYRPPRKGEWYVSGAIPEAYRAPNDLSTAFWIVEIVRTKAVEVRTVLEVVK